MAPFTARIIDSAPRLAVVSRHGVGYDNVDVAALTAARIPLTVTGTANSVTVAEHSLFFMMSLAKHGVKFDREVRKGNWDIRFENTAIDLAGRRVLILGFGRIGQLLVKRCLGLDMVVSVHDPYASDGAVREAGAEPVTDWRAILPGIDFLSVNCPKTEETTGMVGAAELAAMKETAYVVNTARGGIVDEAALVDALERRVIAGAAVDAFEVEPATADNPMFALDNILVSPHSAGSRKNPCSGWGPRARRTWSIVSTGSWTPRTSSTGRCWAETAPASGIPGGTRRECATGDYSTTCRFSAANRPRRSRSFVKLTRWPS